MKQLRDHFYSISEGGRRALAGLFITVIAVVAVALWIAVIPERLTPLATERTSRVADTREPVEPFVRRESASPFASVGASFKSLNELLGLDEANEKSAGRTPREQFLSIRRVFERGMEYVYEKWSRSVGPYF